MFHRTFSVPRHAASALVTILPDELVKRITWDTLRTKPDKFVDAKLTSRYSDVLFEVELNHRDAFIYVLYEHKSEPEKWTLLQLLEYMVRIWRSYLHDRGEKPRNKPVDCLPVILPVVLHHGRTGWTAARRFIEYFGEVQDALRPYLVDFGILLDDVGKVHPDELLVRPLTAEAKVALLCLLLGRTPHKLFLELPKWGEQLAEVWHKGEGGLFFSAVILYMQRVGGIPEEETTMALQQVLKLSPAEEILFADKVLEQRAFRKGTREGMLGMLSKLLEHRFGAVPAHVTTSLEAATQSELEEMGLRVLRATTLDEVVGKPKRTLK